jgi:hypothetical protein
LKQRVEETARQLDEKYEIKAKVTQTTRTATDALKRGAEIAREEVSRVDREHEVSRKVSEGSRRVADAAQEVIRNSGVKEKTGEFVDDAKTVVSDIFGDAKNYYSTATGAARASTSAARLPSSIIGAVTSARDWIHRNPGKAAVVSLAIVAGARAGSAFSSLDVAVLGAGGAGAWLFHSAVLPYGLRKLSQKYETYLKKQEQLIREGKLSEAEQARVRFERNAAKYVGAPLLGAFSVAAGAGLVYEAVTGGVVTGFPISLVLGGNPLLSSIWLFGNGLICFHNGYKFFMMALGDQEEVQRVVRDLKGLLPSAAPAS